MDSKPKSSRRGFLWGAAATGAAATAVATLPQVRQDAVPASTEPESKPERGGGYRLSEHIKRYYQTTRT